MRRTRHDVKAAILKSCAFNDLSISQLLASQNLSYKILKPALNDLASYKLVEYEYEGRRKLVRTTERGIDAFHAYDKALTLLEGHQISPQLDEAPRSLAGRERRLWNNVIEQKDRTILPRPIILE